MVGTLTHDIAPAVSSDLMTPFHLIPLPLADPTWTMAADESLWEAIALSDAPIITLHQFEEDCVTLGFAQEPEELEVAGLANLPWTRRLTGGGAIHHHDRTLSFGLIAADLGEGGPKSPGPIACALGRFLQTVWDHLGLETWIHPCGDSAQQSAPLCADRLYAGDVLHGDVKVAGIGQRRSRGRLLVQAALMLDRAEIASEVAQAELRRALAAAVQIEFGAPLQERALTSEESDRAGHWRQARYTQADWKQRRRLSARART